MDDERVILSEKLEDLRKAVEWGRKQQEKILEEQKDILMSNSKEDMKKDLRKS